MRSVTANFEELMQRVEQGRDFAHASFEPIFYLVYHPSELIDVKRQLPAWVARLRQQGWSPHVLSLTDIVLDICRGAKARPIWLRADSKAPQSWDRSNNALANALAQGELVSRVAAGIEAASEAERGLVLVTDLEALHPYTRIGSIETQLYGRFLVPTVILYPGERTGKTRLSYLGFYPEDGNYRSVHVGG